MKYRKILAVLMTMMVGTSILSGCGGEASSESSSSSVSDETSDTQSASTESEGSSEGEGTDYGRMETPVILNREDWSLGGHYLNYRNCSGLLFLTHRFFVKTEKIIFLFCLEISMFVDNSGSYLYMKP